VLFISFEPDYIPPATIAVFTELCVVTVTVLLVAYAESCPTPLAVLHFHGKWRIRQVVETEEKLAECSEKLLPDAGLPGAP
jgi:hypothetical protein